MAQKKVNWGRYSQLIVPVLSIVLIVVFNLFRDPGFFSVEVTTNNSGSTVLTGNLVSILNGAFVFMADICRAVSIPCEIAFMVAKSYVGSESSGDVNIILDIDKDLSEYNVVIAEDIVDTGRTLKKVCEILKSRSPHSFKVVSFLDKPKRRVVDFKADYVLFTIPDTFIVGYGLDYNDYFRNLPYIAEL